MTTATQASPPEELALVKKRREQMLKLVAKGFYNELANYGVQKDEVLKVASHLLDNLITVDSEPGTNNGYYNNIFTIKQIKDDWDASRMIGVQHVTLRPWHPEDLGCVVRWLSQRHIRESFVPAFPESQADLTEYFSRPDSEYFTIEHEGNPVGIVGGENIDRVSGKLEMKKLVGEAGLQSKGIGKRATFGFLYHAFMKLEMHKVYIHSSDINMRNINLNSRFGFELEAILFEELLRDGRRTDVVRMALFKPMWLGIFSPSD